MELNAQQKDAVHFQLSQLLEFDEPAAFVATLQRVAERKAFQAMRAADPSATASWHALAIACAKIGEELQR